MPEKRSTLQDEIAHDVLPDDSEHDIKGYSVVLESIRSEIETSDSFALKFSVLLKIPVTRAKHMVKHLPCTMWRGGSLPKAKMLVELAAEAGGNARIVESEASKPARADVPKQAREKAACQKCGFPLKEGDEFCAFCMTPLEAQVGKRVSGPVIEKHPQIPPARLLFYIVLLLVVVILAFALR